MLLSESPQIHNLTSKLFPRAFIQRDINMSETPSADLAFGDNILMLEQLLQSVPWPVFLVKTVYLLLSFLNLVARRRW